MRMASWNVNYRGSKSSAALGQLIREADIDLLMLQEVNPSSLDTVINEAGLDWSVTAFDAGAPYPASSGRRRVAALAGRGPAPLVIGTLPELALPERMVFAQVATGGGSLTLASYHAPPGVSWGYTKVEHAQSLLRWIDTTTGPLIVGADANTPKVDHPNPDLVRTHWQTGSRRLNGRPGDEDIFGGHPRHRLRDAYRVSLENHPALLDSILRERPNGPLATSHRTGRRRDHEGNPCRYDALWISPDFAVTSISYDYAGAIAAGSDHALVVADLT